MLLKWNLYNFRKHRYPILLASWLDEANLAKAAAVSDNDLAVAKINIFHAQADAFHKPEPSPYRSWDVIQIYPVKIGDICVTLHLCSFRGNGMDLLLHALIIKLT